jgi:hypothetical protein
MSSPSDYTRSLQTAQMNLYVIGGPILMFIGIVNCIFNLIIFMKKKLRENPCSICLIAFNTSSFLLICFSFLPAMLQIGFNIDPSSSNLVYCRIRYYLGFVFTCLPPFYLILASIDRTFITSSKVRTRQWSNRKFICKCIIGLTVFWILFHIHALILTNIIQFGPNYFLCYFNPGLYTVLTSYYSLIVNGLIPPVLLAIFALLTIKNMHQSRTRIISLHTTVTQRRNRQLIKMLLTEILICLIFGFVHPSVLLYRQLNQYTLDDYQLMILEQFFISVSTFVLHIPYCLSFYTNLIVSKTFRKEIISLFQN